MSMHRSLWLREAVDKPPQPALEGSTQADVCIVGGGFVGLWTAIWLKAWDPACDVVVLEQDICGGGASGRNGGFALSWWAKFPSLRKILGLEDAVWVCRQSASAIDELRRFCEDHEIDAHFVRGG
jgi:glycine/D-amino acid oxidase-like deaminating enzyme